MINLWHIYYVYILYSKQFDKYYFGQTIDVEARLHRHNNGYENAAKTYTPWVMLLFMEKDSRQQSIALEKKLKNLSKERILLFIEKYRRCWRGKACQNADKLR